MTQGDRQLIEGLSRQVTDNHQLTQQILFKLAGGGPMKERGLIEQQQTDTMFQGETVLALREISKQLADHGSRIESLEKKKKLSLISLGATGAGATSLGIYAQDIVQFFKTLFNIRP